MNYIDIIIILYLVWGFYSGFKKGAVYMLVSFASILFALYAAVHFSYLSTGLLAQWLGKDPQDLKILSYIVTFIVVFILMHLIGKILDHFIKAVALGFINRLLGGLLSVGIKVIILSLLIWVFDQGNQIMPLVSQKTIDESVMYKPLRDLSPVILVNLENLKNNKKIDDLKEKVVPKEKS
jgi:membrane protein required for colicin V production